MSCFLISPSTATGNNRRIELTGSDIRIVPSIDNVFVYSSSLNIDQLNDALSRALSLWPLIAGRCLLIDDDYYFIEMSDNPIPVTFVENTELNKWPLDCNVVRDTFECQLPQFLDEVPSAKLLFHYQNEPLFRLKLTHIMQSNEWVMGTSWSHILGDAAVCANFLHTLSRFYQQLEPLEPLPVFERRLWCKDEVDRSLLPTMRHLTDGVTAEQIHQVTMREQMTHDQLNLHLPGEQLANLRRLIVDNTLTTHDVLIAYIILTLNVYCYSNEKQVIFQTSIVVDYHGVSNSIAPLSLAANCHLRAWFDSFEDPYSLLSIAKTIRRIIIRSRNSEFLERWIPTADELFRDLARNDLRMNADHFSNGIVVNSNFRYDWANLVDFGYTDKCRFYTDGTKDLFLRVFRPNPIYNGTRWISRDGKGAEIAFRIEKSIKQKFLDAWQRDLKENFINVKR